MEVAITNYRRTSFGFAELKDEAEFKRNTDFSKNSTKEEVFIFEAKSVQITGRQKECVFQRCDKEASHAKRATGEEMSIS